MSDHLSHGSQPDAQPPSSACTLPADHWSLRYRDWFSGRRWLQPWLLWGRDLVRSSRERRLARESSRLDEIVRTQAQTERVTLQALRRQHAARYRRPLEPPLISIVVPTYNRCDLLLQRTLPSLLAQDYPRFEVVIVGDACTDETGPALARLGDPRVRFENIPQRQPYPADRAVRYLVTGVRPLNRAIELAQGDWLAQCDDDELLTANHLWDLWEFAERYGYEYVWGQQVQEISPGRWVQQGSSRAGLYDIPHSTLLYRQYLRCFPYDEDAWKVGLCHDRHRLRRMSLAGARGGFLPRVVTLAPLRPNTTRSWAAAEDRP